ncbi:glycosyltransferase [Mycetocola reblochoni]|nr:glycosyltransferase [Mycetocola reblochoni]RLP70459.1 glycosyltransferase family 2 protein [Mycetocola reblochoni]
MSLVVQNLVFPLDRDPDILPLYLDAETWTTVGHETVRVSDFAHVDDVLDRSSARVRPGRRVSFASYFNAFPASYWQHWTTVREVTLELSTEGSGTVLVYRSNANGVAQRVESRDVSGGDTVRFSLPVTNFTDGGWYWFDAVAGSEELIIRSGSWSTDATPRTTANASIGITTMNKPDYCVRNLAALAKETALLTDIDTIYVVDQGTTKVQDREEFPAVAEALGDKLTVINQANLGGSGGFSRSMSETLDAGTSGFVLLLDDDVEVEPEGIFRSIQFSRFSSRPTIVGGHMFDLLDKPILHAFSENIDLHPFLWRPGFDEQIRHDFRVSNLRQTPWMHARMDADYNGWWMCMIPVEVIRDIGLSIPVFIKWDDSEYGLRARSRGYRTVSLPGSALWHISWIDKDDSQDWQAYYHARNRLVAGLLHSPYSKGGRLLSNSSRISLKHLLSMQYYAVELRNEAIRDLLTGPEHLHRTMGTKLPELRAQAADFSETSVYTADSDVPPTREGRRSYPLHTEPSPAGASLAVFTAKAAARHWLTSPADQSQPQVELAKRDATWWRVPGFDSALISTADGRGSSWYRRDRSEFRALLKESLRLHRELERNWDALAEQYRRALPEFTSQEAWKTTFEQ